MWAYSVLLECGSTIKRVLDPTATNRHLISLIWSRPLQCKTTSKKHDIEAVWKELIDELAGR